MSAWGVFLLDGAARLLWANRAATVLLAEPGCPFLLRQGMLVAAGGGVALAGSAAGARPAMVRVARPGRLPLSVMVSVGPAGVLTFVADPKAGGRVDPRLLEVEFGLSRAEAEVAVALACGADVPGLAERRRTTVATVRTQIRSVLARTGQRTQAQLAGAVSHSLTALLRC